MKANVDRDACTGCELCVSSCPEVFEMDAEGIAVATSGDIPDGLQDSCRQAAEDCPSGAIAVEN